MKISHETPLSLLNESNKFNDYQYVLPHLIDKYESYKNYMLSYRKNSDSFIICDNGLFEGVEHTQEDLIEKINLIKPDIFVVPDEWNNMTVTYRNAKYWMNVIKEQLPKETNLMVVMQGYTLGDFMNLYNQCVSLGYTHFAFNHSSQYYQNDGYHPNPLVNQMMNRIYVISRLYKEKIIHDSHYVHLLGCSSYLEGIYYKDNVFPFIKSVDTSSPIINGYLNIKYSNNKIYKPLEKIEDILTLDMTDSLTIIEENIKLFRNIWS